MMVYIASVLFGLVVGSFANVCILRLPLNESLWSPGSHCPGCHRPLKIIHNIPVLSYLALKGMCAFCGTRQRTRPPRPKNRVPHARDEFVAGVAHHPGKHRQKPGPTGTANGAKRGYNAIGPQQRRFPSFRPVRYEDERAEVLSRQPMLLQILLGRGALQRRKAEPAIAIESEQPSDNSVAQAAFAVVEQDGVNGGKIILGRHRRVYFFS